MDLRNFCFLLLTVFSISYVNCLYSSQDDVVELTASNFQTKVVNSDELWLVEFYAPWCGHCKNLAPAWKSAATALRGIVRIGAVDMTAHESLGQSFQIKGFPTIYVFGADKKNPKEFQSSRDVNSIVNEALSQARSLVMSRLNSDGRRDSSSSHSSSYKESSGSGGEVVTLTDDNFEKLVYGSKDIWLVEFYAPWCGHCKQLEPEWRKAAAQLAGKVRLGALDATVYTKQAGIFGIQGFPTIKFFPAGSNSPQDAEEYSGAGRTADAIVAWGLERAELNAPAPEVQELVRENQLAENCVDSQLCVVAVLPVLLDCQADCRNNYLRIFRASSERLKRNKWAWLWTEAGSQSQVESSLGIGGFGYPAMAAINARKKIFSILKGPFNEDGLHEFLLALSVGRGVTEPLRGSGDLPVVRSATPWDGKDGKAVEEEEIDLSELDLDSPRSGDL